MQYNTSEESVQDMPISFVVITKIQAAIRDALSECFGRLEDQGETFPFVDVYIQQCTRVSTQLFFSYLSKECDNDNN